MNARYEQKQQIFVCLCSFNGFCFEKTVTVDKIPLR